MNKELLHVETIHRVFHDNEMNPAGILPFDYAMGLTHPLNVILGGTTLFADMPRYIDISVIVASDNKSATYTFAHYGIDFMRVDVFDEFGNWDKGTVNVNNKIVLRNKHPQDDKVLPAFVIEEIFNNFIIAMYKQTTEIISGGMGGIWYGAGINVDGYGISIAVNTGVYGIKEL